MHIWWRNYMLHLVRKRKYLECSSWELPKLLSQIVVMIRMLPVAVYSSLRTWFQLSNLTNLKCRSSRMAIKHITYKHISDQEENIICECLAFMFSTLVVWLLCQRTFVRWGASTNAMKHVENQDPSSLVGNAMYHATRAYAFYIIPPCATCYTV